MIKLFYSKYSNERDVKFQIRTSILKENNQKIVRKIALTEEAKQHIDNIYENYNILKQIYNENKRVRINECKKMNSGLEFDYVEGNTLEEIIEKLILEEEHEEVLKKISEYVKLIETLSSNKEFEVTNLFKTIFGDVDVCKGLKSSEISNIDMIFSNIIINENINIIDYEWVFKCPVPHNFIIYRALESYNCAHKSSYFNEDIYRKLGIKKEELKIYNEMEINFQKYVKGNLVLLDEIYEKINNKNYSFLDILERDEKCELVCYLKDNTAIDYNEEFTLRKIINCCAVRETFNLTEYDLKELRIDPATNNCIIKNLSIYTIKDNKKIELPIKYTNSNFSYDNKYIFTHEDPQIYINLLGLKVKTLFIEYDFISHNKEDINEIIKAIITDLESNKEYVNEKISLIKDIELKLKENYEKNRQIELELNKKNEYINQIHYSKWWKIREFIYNIIKKHK